MVTRGQFLERPTLFSVGRSALEGLSHRGSAEPPLLIVPPAPADGSMDHVVAAEVAWAAAQAGHATLRFNHRGVGASQGEQGGEPDRLEDVEGALRLLQENAGVIGCAVLALGSAAPVVHALGERHPGLRGLIFVSPSGLAPAELARAKKPLLVIAGAKDLRQPRAALAAAVGEAGGTFELVEEADGAFLRNLPEVGRRVAQWLAGLADRS